MNTGPDPTTIPAVQLIAVVEMLERERIPYAVGGAVALGYWSQGRGTEDLDFNIFLPASRAGEIFALLARLGVGIPEDAMVTVEREDHVRTKWAPFLWTSSSPTTMFTKSVSGEQSGPSLARRRR